MSPAFNTLFEAEPVNDAVIVPALKFPELLVTTVFPEVSVDDVFNPSSKSAFKFVTNVVEETVSGAVPVAIVDIS